MHKDNGLQKRNLISTETIGNCTINAHQQNTIFNTGLIACAMEHLAKIMLMYLTENKLKLKHKEIVGMDEYIKQYYEIFFDKETIANSTSYNKIIKSIKIAFPKTIKLAHWI